MTIVKIVKKISEKSSAMLRNKKYKTIVDKLNSFEINVRIIQYILNDERLDQSYLIKTNCKIFEKMYSKTLLDKGFDHTIKNQIITELAHKITHSIKTASYSGDLINLTKKIKNKELNKDVCNDAIVKAWVDFLFSNSKKYHVKDYLGYGSVDELYKNRDKIS